LKFVERMDPKAPEIPEPYRKAMEAGAMQMEKFRSELAAEKAARERAAAELAAEKAARTRDAEEMKKLSSFYDKYRKDRSTTFSGMYDREISPYFEELRKSAGEIDPAISDRVASLGGTLQASLTSGVTDPHDEDQLLVLRACASVQKHTSSALEKALKTEKEWAQKYEGLMQKLNEQEARAKEMEARAKDMEARMHKEPAQDRLMNPATHFERPVVMEAVASGAADRNFSSLFSLAAPTTDWRSRFPEAPSITK
jgi:hypothetical protein